MISDLWVPSLALCQARNFLLQDFVQRHPARDIPTEGGLVPPSVGMLSVTGPEIGLRAGRRACHGEIKNKPTAWRLSGVVGLY